MAVFGAADPGSNPGGAISDSSAHRYNSLNYIPRDLVDDAYGADGELTEFGKAYMKGYADGAVTGRFEEALRRESEGLEEREEEFRRASRPTAEMMRRSFDV